LRRGGESVVTSGARGREQAATSAVPTARVPVVVVHGLWMRGGALQVLRRRLAARGYDVHVFTYPSVAADLATNAGRLASFIERVPGETVHVVAHSLGGIVVRAMLERGAPARLGRVVCLGPPFAGSRAAARVARLPGGARIIGRSLGDLLARGGFDAWRSNCEIGIIAGRVPFGVGRLFGVGEQSDGTVAIAETRLVDAHDHIVLRCAHMSLLWSAEVARQVEHFLRTGRFDRA
jgi:pimeloyl-ACP methyl ester carboxylesterase